MQSTYMDRSLITRSREFPNGISRETILSDCLDGLKEREKTFEEIGLHGQAKILRKEIRFSRDVAMSDSSLNPNRYYHLLGEEEVANWEKWLPSSRLLSKFREEKIPSDILSEINLIRECGIFELKSLKVRFMKAGKFKRGIWVTYVKEVILIGKFKGASYLIARWGKFIQEPDLELDFLKEEINKLRWWENLFNLIVLSILVILVICGCRFAISEGQTLPIIVLSGFAGGTVGMVICIIIHILFFNEHKKLTKYHLQR